MPGTTGSIVWSRTDPKTWELYNTDRDAPPGAPMGPPAEYEQGVADVSAQMFEELQQKSGFAPAEPSQEAQRRAWRKQLRLFDQTLKKSDDPNRLIDDQIQGIQELLDTGAIWMDDEGNVFSATETHPGGQKGNQRLLDAARQWNDWYKDQLAYGEDVGSEADKYWEEAVKAAPERLEQIRRMSEKKQ